MGKSSFASHALPVQFGRYRIMKMIGEGGMGAVYLARDTQLDRDVALKVPQFANDDDSVLDRFFQEARAAATVQHPNICPIFDVGEIDGIHYLAMALIEGKPLEAWAGGQNSLTCRQCAVLVRKVASAMHEAHKKGIIHRDLKPSNIMIDRRGEPIVMDFGLARRLEAGDHRLTQSGTIMGSPAYVAPEQLKGEIDAIGPGSDVYALGVILYELLTNRPPFVGADNMAVLAQVLLDEPPPPSKFRPDVEPALEAICLKAMAKKIEDRYASMSDLAASLQEYLRGNGKPNASRSSANSPTPLKAEAPGFNTSRIGGLRSLAQLHAGLQAPRILIEPKTIEAQSKPRPSSRRKARSRRLPPWIWIAVGSASTVVLVFVAIVGFRLAYPHSPTDLAVASNGSRTAKPTKPADAAPPGKQADQAVARDDPRQAPPAKPAVAKESIPGEIREFEIAPGSKMKFCWIPPGEAQLGSTPEEQDYVLDQFFNGQPPTWWDAESQFQRGKYRSKGFWLGKYTVMQSEWQTVMGNNPSRYCAGGEGKDDVFGLDTSRFPVEEVRWEDATQFLDKLNALGGTDKAFDRRGKFVLPNENEWEYACRGGKGNKQAFYFGDEFNATQANCNGNFPYKTEAKGPFLQRTIEVGTYEKVAPHPWGLCDMYGNVWQWCENWSDNQQNYRIIRGGSWHDTTGWCRSAMRGLGGHGYHTTCGFRACFRLD